MKPDLEEIFSAQGPLAQKWKHYEHRTQQVEMARAVHDALEQRMPTLIEAATGTGKTLAYLAAVWVSEKKVIISTNTKALQEQLFQKDIPLLQSLMGESRVAALVKGRKNYLCQLRHDEMSHQPRFRVPKDARHWATIQAWAKTTLTGDRGEIPGLPDDYATWNDLSVDSTACLGAKCDFYETCHITALRQRTQKADIVVVNHHLFFADLALRQGGFAEILPEVDAVIFDEAHHLENVATPYFGLRVSNWRFRELIGDTQRTLQREAKQSPQISAALGRLEQSSKAFFLHLARGLRETRHLLGPVVQKQSENIETAHQEVAAALAALRRRLLVAADLGEPGERLAERCALLRGELSLILAHDDPRFVYFIELRNQGCFLEAAPIDLAGILRTHLLESHDTLIFTSATLTSGGDFSFFKERTGIAAHEGHDETYREAWEVRELVLPPVFDYPSQCRLYIARDLVEPNRIGFADEVAEKVLQLTAITQGRAFVLFTSYANMHAVFDRVSGEIAFPILKQGQRPKGELLELFRAQTSSVLFATQSFWEGVDVEGESLSLVIIDKLPFASPADPLIRARSTLLESRGINPFTRYTVPMAALALKQGFGRLVRSKTDRGIVAILDSRLSRKFYGSYFLRTLPDAPKEHHIAGLQDWWHAHKSP